MEDLQEKQDPVVEWSYSGDLSKDLDWVRFTIGDTDPDEARMSDTEIQSMLDMERNKEEAALSCMKHILILLAQETDYKIGSTSESRSKAYEAYKKAYEALKADINAGNVQPQVIRGRGIFSVGMMDER